MAMESPGSGPARPEARWTRAAPPTPAQQLAQELIDEDLRAGEPRPQRQPGRSGALARLREWLRRRFSSGAAAPPGEYAPLASESAARNRLTKQPPPGHSNGAPPANGSEKSARQKVAEFSTPELEQVLHAILERIAEDPKLQQAYQDKKLPVVEELLQRTEPSQAGRDQDSPTVQQSPTVGDFAAATAHPASPPDGPSATVNFAESTAHPATPTADTDVSPAPSNPVTHMGALTLHATNVNITYAGDGSVNMTQQGSRSVSASATTPAAGQTTSATSANRSRRR